MAQDTGLREGGAKVAQGDQNMSKGQLPPYFLRLCFTLSFLLFFQLFFHILQCNESCVIIHLV